MKTLTFEDMQEAFAKACNKGSTWKPIISYHAYKILLKIRQIEPNWKYYSGSTEIYYKAKQLRIKCSFP